MSKAKRDSLTSEAFVERNRFADSIPSLNIYYIRIHDPWHSLTIRMKFGDGITFQFEPGRPMNPMNASGPFIYILQLNLSMILNKLYVQHEDILKPVDAYRLQLLHPLSVIGNSVHEEKDDRVHTLKDCFDRGHCFLFDIRFGSRFKLNAPGRTLSSIRY